jgi:hypothetical protein
MADGGQAKTPAGRQREWVLAVTTAATREANLEA